MNLPTWVQWVTVLAPLVPVVLHVTGIESSTFGKVVTSLLPDILGAFKKLAPPKE